MPIYNLIEWSNNYSKTSGGLWQYYGDEPADAIVNSELSKFKIIITVKSPADGNPKDVKITLP